MSKATLHGAKHSRGSCGPESASEVRLQARGNTCIHWGTRYMIGALIYVKEVQYVILKCNESRGTRKRHMICAAMHSYAQQELTDNNRDTQ